MGYGQLAPHISMPGKGVKTANEFVAAGTGEEWWMDPHFNLYATRVTVRVEQT